MEPDQLMTKYGETTVSNNVKSEYVGLLPAQYGELRPISPPQFPLQVVSEAALDFHAFEQSKKAHPLPDAYQMYPYGKRTISYSSQLPVSYANNGVIIVHEFQGVPPEDGREAMFQNDEAIQNPHWRHIGAMNPPARDPHRASTTQSAGFGASRPPDPEYWTDYPTDFSEAVDMKGMHLFSRREAPAVQRFAPDFSALFRVREGGGSVLPTAQRVKQTLQREIMGEQGNQQFFSDREAVSYESH